MDPVKKQKTALSAPKPSRLFADPVLRIRYLFALGMILAMVGIAELTGEKEIIFPEMAALTIGLWIVDKRVWTVKKWQLIFLMTLGALVGIGIVRLSLFPLIVNLLLAFSFTAICLLFTNTTLIPLISACMLPVLLQTESWIYPSAVFVMSVLIAGGQKIMEKYKLRTEIPPLSLQRQWKKDSIRWLSIGGTLFFLSAFALYTSQPYFIIPPLIVTYVEFVNSKAGFRNRPVQTLLLLVTASTIGTFFQIIGYQHFHLPETIVVLCIFICLFTLFEWIGKFFAPAAALALIPTILPQRNLIWLPLQVTIGATLLIATALLLFQQCYKWPKAQLIVCLLPFPIRKQLNRKKEKPTKNTK